MSVEQVEVIIPASVEDRKALKASVKELVNSLTRIQGEQDYIKETVKELAEKYNIPAKLIKKMATDEFRDAFEKNAAIQDTYEALYETIMKQSHVVEED